MIIKTELTLSVFLSGAVVAALCLFNQPALGQENPNKKIPFEVIEDKTAGDSMAPAKQLRLGLGVNLDFFPTVLSAVDGEFGLSIQPWFGIDRFKLRLNITHMRIPESLVGTRYFHKNSANTFSLVLEYCFGSNFDGFTVGAGVGVCNNMVSHRYFNRKGNSIAPFVTIEGGYIWKFYNNLFIEPCLALDVMVTGQKIKVWGFNYKPLPVTGEISIKFGINVDI
ncbi:MAG: hypothetical protein KA369_03720 [Spirochaetes bacterium]|nr:hypothetical protein [Spirochaetota bacterium]